MILLADSKGPDQTGQMLSLIWSLRCMHNARSHVFAWRCPYYFCLIHFEVKNILLKLIVKYIQFFHTFYFHSIHLLNTLVCFFIQILVFINVIYNVIIEVKWQKTFLRTWLVQIQISLGIHAVWSESSLGIFWLAKNAKFMWTAKSLTEPISRLIWVFVGCTFQKVCFHTLWLRYWWYHSHKVNSVNPIRPSVL